MLCLFTEINWSLDEVILEKYWRVLQHSVIISPISFTLTAEKRSHHRNGLEIQKPEEVLSQTYCRTTNFCQKILFLSRDPFSLSKLSITSQSERQFIDTLLLSKIFLQILIQQRTLSLHLLVLCSCPIESRYHVPTFLRVRSCNHRTTVRKECHVLIANI